MPPLQGRVNSGRSAAVLGDSSGEREKRRVFSAETSSLIANILSDPEARRLEFGSGNLLNFPSQTAVKTGTSTDYRDAWAIGFNHRYTVGVWMGNLDAKPMQGITGSIGPALVLRSVFAELGRFEESRPLYLSPRLDMHDDLPEFRRAGNTGLSRHAGVVRAGQDPEKKMSSPWQRRYGAPGKLMLSPSPEGLPWCSRQRGCNWRWTREYRVSWRHSPSNCRKGSDQEN